MFLVKEYFDRLQEKFDFIHNIIKDLSSVDLNPVDGELDEITDDSSSEDKDVKIYKQKRIGIPIEKLYEVLFAKLLKIDKFKEEDKTYFGWKDVEDNGEDPKIILNSQTLICSETNEGFKTFTSTNDVDEYIKLNLGIDSEELLKKFGSNIQNLDNELKKKSSSVHFDDAKFFINMAKLVVKDDSFTMSGLSFKKI